MFKKAFAILGSLAVIGVGTSLAQSAGPARKQIESQKKASVRAEFQNRFVDENGDGINDLFRDHDGDGIPNGQDPDWAPPEDGTGLHGGIFDAGEETNAMPLAAHGIELRGLRFFSRDDGSGDEDDEREDKG